MKKTITEDFCRRVNITDTDGKFTSIHEWAAMLIPEDVPEDAAFSVSTEYYYEGHTTYLIWRWTREREETDAEAVKRERKEERDLAAKIKRRRQKEAAAAKALAEEQELYLKLKAKYES